MNAVIISLNYHPGHFSHLIANYKLFEDSGFTSYLYVNETFNSMDEKNEFRKINNPEELKTKVKKIDVAVFWFPSLKNIIEIIRLKFFYKAQVFYVYHEPFDSLKNYYNANFSLKKIAKICFVNLVNIPVVFLSHKIVLPSKSALAMYEEKYTLLNKNYALIPLLFDDEAPAKIEVSTKKYISYIGTIAADHAFDRFVDFVYDALKNNWFPETSFLIAVSSKLSERDQKILGPYLQSDRLVIRDGKRMTNAEINQHYQDSLVVWNAYHRSMQSGVLPKAYMFGAPVIVLARNANEFIENYKTGVLINDNKNTVEIKTAILEILSKKEFYFENCRKKFAENFYYKNKIDDYLSLLDNKPKILRNL